MGRALALVLLVACGSPPSPSASAPRPVADPTPSAPPPARGPAKQIKNTTLAAIGLDPTAMDRTVDPCEDFYQFACGGWIAKTEIPADQSMIMRTIDAMREQTETFLHGVLEKARTAPGSDPLLQQLGAFYGACMDETAVEKLGTKPIAPLLAQIAKVNDAKTLSTAVIAVQAVNANPLFWFGPVEDSADASKMIAGLDQSGLGLPDRSFYVSDTPAATALRAAYLEYATTMLTAIGHKAAAAKTEADDIVALETELAKISKDKVARRDPKASYNKIDRSGVMKAMPHFEWDAYFKALGQDKLLDITTSYPEFLVGLDALIVKTPARTWRNYLTLHLLRSTAMLLPKQFDEATFKLEQKLGGAVAQRTRSKRCVALTDLHLTHALGQVFVRERFPADQKAAVEQLAQALVAATKHNIDALAWMDAATKAKAQEKLASLKITIGHPASWRTYPFKVDPKQFAGNVLAARRAEMTRMIAKVGRPVDRDEWAISPTTGTGMYNVRQNKIAVAAGVLQNRFEHSTAVHFGARMGIAHEITHAFDDRGAQFDASGSLTNWWQPATAEKFKQRAECVVEQYGAYESGGTKLDGKLTLGENIADIGGVKLALAAYRATRATATATDIADGFTEDQQFFLSFGQSWCAKVRPEAEAIRLATVQHAPAQWRVNGALASTPDFARAFRCRVGAKLRPANACVVW